MAKLSGSATAPRGVVALPSGFWAIGPAGPYSNRGSSAGRLRGGGEAGRGWAAPRVAPHRGTKNLSRGGVAACCGGGGGQQPNAGGGSAACCAGGERARRGRAGPRGAPCEEPPTLGQHSTYS